MQRSARSALTFAIVLAVAVGCGRLPNGTADASPLQSPSDTPAATSSPSSGDQSPSPAATPTPPQTFTSRYLGYTMQLAPNLQHQRSTPPDSDFYGEDDFSNEAVGAPQLMDDNGIFLAVVVTPDAGDQCLQHDLRSATIERQDPVTVDGNATVLNVFSLPSGEPSMVLNVLHSRYCYQFVFIALSRSTRDANEASALQMLSTFQFGTGPVGTLQ